MVEHLLRRSLLQQVEDGEVRCNVCARRCLVAPGAVGWCRTRENRDGLLLTRTYGALSSVEIGSIEDKPFYHFYPGTRALTAGSWSCNLGCPWCQNWEYSHAPPPRKVEHISPERFVGWAERSGCQGVTISFNEPTLSLEWSLDVFKLSRAHGLYNAFVTNGYMTGESLDLLVAAGLDALSVDIKGDSDAVSRFCQADVDEVWDICDRAAARGIHLELTTLVVPTVNDSDKTLRQIATRLAGELGLDVPWHIIAYRPAYRFSEPPTPREALERAYAIGKETGIRFVYAGNLPGHRTENTHCPDCGALLIQRLGYEVLRQTLRQGVCPGCGRRIAGVWPVRPG